MEGALSEYKDCLALQESILDPDDRTIAQTYFMLAVTHIYNSTSDGKNPINEKKNALSYYYSTRDSLKLRLAKLNAETTPANSEDNSKISNEIEDIKDLIDELNETTEALTTEIDQLQKENMSIKQQDNNSSSNNINTNINPNINNSAFSFGSQTTIGFGAQTSVGFGTQSIGFSSTNNSSINLNINAVQVFSIKY